jgi:hypothetical protein
MSPSLPHTAIVRGVAARGVARLHSTLAPYHAPTHTHRPTTFSTQPRTFQTPPSPAPRRDPLAHSRSLPTNEKRLSGVHMKRRPAPPSRVGPSCAAPSWPVCLQPASPVTDVQPRHVHSMRVHSMWRHPLRHRSPPLCSGGGLCAAPRRATVRRCKKTRGGRRGNRGALCCAGIYTCCRDEGRKEGTMR